MIITHSREIKEEESKAKWLLLNVYPLYFSFLNRKIINKQIMNASALIPFFIYHWFFVVKTSGVFSFVSFNLCKADYLLKILFKHYASLNQIKYLKDYLGLMKCKMFKF